MNMDLKKILAALCLSVTAVGIQAQTQPSVQRHPGASPSSPRLTSWLTDPGNSVFFERQLAQPMFTKARTTLTKDQVMLVDTTSTTGNTVITVDDTKAAQVIDGFGFALTGGSAMNIMKMSPASRFTLLKEMFSTNGNNIGTSYIRR